VNKNHKDILIINWRGFKDPLSGGAEVATMEHAKRWVLNHGANVTWLSPPPYSNAKNESLIGVEFVYLGKNLTRNVFTLFFKYIYFCILVFVNYILKYKNSVDVVIDQVHGLPFLTPLYIKNKKIIMYIHEVAGEIWTKMYPFPLGFIGRLVEPLFFLPYKDIKVVTGTEYAKKDLINVGIPKENINLIGYGITNPIAQKKPSKEKELTIVFLNRLVKMKRIELALDIFSEILKKEPNAVFWVVGKGESDYIEFLKQKCIDLKIQDNVKFWGFVDDKTKLDLLAKSTVLINTSTKEGWGLVNIEANSQGTPVVSFDVSGNNESIINGESGLLVPNNDSKGMIDSIFKIYKSQDTWYDSCLNHAKKFDWNDLSNKFYSEMLK